MFVALNENNERCYAWDYKKDEKYFCPICGGELIVKDGSVNATHFAHKTDCTDTWHYDMSGWHRKWQEQFSPICRERVIRHNGEVHRADIETRNYIIEFQHSPISAEEFYARNKFFLSYGKKVIWIFDMREQFESSIEFLDDSYSGFKFNWNHPFKCFRDFVPQYDKDILLFFQINDSLFDIENNMEDFESYANEHMLCPLYLEKVVWAIYDEYNDCSNFKKFVTESIVNNKTELVKFLNSGMDYKTYTRKMR